MGLINHFIITLVSTIIFMTAIELIAPNNNMKKYLKFVLGLILIATLLNPIILFIKGGESSIITAINSYEKEVLGDEKSVEGERMDESKIREQSFKNNFNISCMGILKKEFKDMDFESDINCTMDFNKVDFEINKLTIGIKKSNIKKIRKVVIGEENNKKPEDETQLKIKEFASKELGIDKEKIEVIYK